MKISNLLVKRLVELQNEEPWKNQENSKSSLPNYQKKSMWRCLCILSRFISHDTILFLLEEPNEEKKETNLTEETHSNAPQGTHSNPPKGMSD